MNKEPKIHTVHVFANSHNLFGNPVGIVLDENKKLDDIQCQEIAKKLNYSETVFINNLLAGNVNIFNPIRSVTFAGHALVGTAWFINKISKIPLNYLMCVEEKIFLHQDNFTWIKAPLDITPPWNHQELENAQAVENLKIDQIKSYRHTIVWAWLNREKGILRARTFAPDWGISEDEANGSGAMQLTAKLQTNLTIIHGKGSIIYTKLFDQNYVEIGGLCYEL